MIRNNERGVEIHFDEQQQHYIIIIIIIIIIRSSWLLCSLCISLHLYFCLFTSSVLMLPRTSLVEGLNYYH
jgi:hypothetical protein